MSNPPDFEKIADEIIFNRTGRKRRELFKAELHRAYNAGLEAAIEATAMGGLGRIAVRARKLPVEE